MEEYPPTSTRQEGGKLRFFKKKCGKNKKLRLQSCLNMISYINTYSLSITLLMYRYFRFLWTIAAKHVQFSLSAGIFRSFCLNPLAFKPTHRKRLENMFVSSVLTFKPEVTFKTDKQCFITHWYRNCRHLGRFFDLSELK